MIPNAPTPRRALTQAPAARSTRRSAWTKVALATALVGAITFTGGAGVTAASAAPTSSTAATTASSSPAYTARFTARSTDLPVLGTTITMIGLTSAKLAGATATVQRYSGGKWKNLPSTTAMPRTVNQFGYFTTTTKSTTVGKFDYRVRITTKKGVVLATTSAMRFTVQKVTPTLTIDPITAPGRIVVGQKITVSGFASPLLAGKKVALQRWSNGAWVSQRATATVSKAGSYSISTKADTAGPSVKYRVVTAATATLKATTSAYTSVPVYSR
jgi:hypothetical protein